MGEYMQGKKTGIVTSLYKTSRRASVGSALESLTIAVDFIPSVLVARRMDGIGFGLGASILISKDTLRDIGGFAAVADYLADDYQLGYRCAQKGYENVLSGYVVENRVGRMEIGEYLLHQLRWARTYRASRPKGFAGYGITHIFPFASCSFSPIRADRPPGSRAWRSLCGTRLRVLYIGRLSAMLPGPGGCFSCP